MKTGIRWLNLVFLALLAACQTAPKPGGENQIVSAERENELGVELEQNLRRAYGALDDKNVERVLNLLAAALAEAATDPGAASAAKEDPRKPAREIKVVVLASMTPYAAAGIGGRVYISKGMLNAASYENELAFILATQLALIRVDEPLRRLTLLQGQEVGENLISLPTTPPARKRDFLAESWFEPGGLFDYGAKAFMAAEQSAVKTIYGAKYDPRGSVTHIQQWIAPESEAAFRPLGKIMPDAAERLRIARDEVAKLSPLRDPIVKSEAFDELSARLRKTRKAKLRKTKDASS